MKKKYTDEEKIIRNCFVYSNKRCFSYFKEDNLLVCCNEKELNSLSLNSTIHVYRFLENSNIFYRLIFYNSDLGLNSGGCSLVFFIKNKRSIKRIRLVSSREISPYYFRVHFKIHEGINNYYDFVTNINWKQIDEESIKIFKKEKMKRFLEGEPLDIKI